MTDNVKLDLSRDGSDTYEVTDRHRLIPKCPVCKRGSDITLRGSDYFAYFQRGAYIQDAFPYLTPEEREVMMTGLHPGDCNKKFWADLGEEDDEPIDDPWNPIEQGMYDDDPSPYDGTYSED